MTGTSAAAGLAAVLAASAVVLLVRPRTRVPAALATPRSTRPRPVVLAVPAVAAAVLLSSALVTGRRLALVLVAGGALLGAVRLLQRSRATARAGRRSRQVLAACDAVAADLSAGQPPLAALDRAARAWPELAPAVAAAHLGADVPSVLRELGQRPGGAELRALAAAWQVGHESGCGLAEAVATTAEGIRERQATQRLVGAELAAAHATARLMVVLPFGVLLLGAGVGGDPVGFLMGTAPGIACLAAGLALGYAGLLWLHRIADQVLER
jgi:tight adherence protein B